MPRGNDLDTQAYMAAQLATEYEPEKEPVPAYRPSTARYYFRSDPGYRQPRIRIPGVLDSFKNDEDEKVLNFHKLRYEKAYPDPKVRKMHEDVRDALNGEWYISFTHVPNRFEAYLETESDVLADYIRSLIASGELKFVYEDTGRNPRVNVPTHRAQAELRLREAAEEAVTQTA